MLLLLIPVLRNLSADNDLNIFYLAATELRDGGNPYDGPHMDGLWYYYSPLFATLLIPFTYFPIPVLKVVWMALGFALINRNYVLLGRFLPVTRDQRGLIYLIGLGIICYHVLFMNLLYGQMTILMLWCCLESLWQWRQSRNWKSAWSLAAGINIKVLPIFLLWFYFLKAEFRLLVRIALTLAVLMLLPYILFPDLFHNSIMADWLSLLNPLRKEHVNTIGEGGFIDFASIITKYFSGNRIPGEPDHTLSIWSTATIFKVQMAARLTIILLSAYVVRKLLPARLSGDMNTLAGAAFILACIPVAFPHQRDYSVMLCVPAIALMLHQYIIQGYRPSRWLIGAALLVFTMMGSVIFFPLLPWDLRYFIQESRIPGFGALLFISVWLRWMSGLKSIPQNNL